MARLKEIAEETAAELEDYLDAIGWSENPFARPPSLDEYVIPNPHDVADVASAIDGARGPVVIHSAFSGAGKTAMAKALLEDLGDGYQTVYVGEHNTTAYELVATIADESGIGKSNSTKMTEQKLRTAEFDRPLLVAIDEFGLNDPATIHTLQFLNDEVGARVILTGMSSQYEALEGAGPEGRAFARRIALDVELGPLEESQTAELVARRIATARGDDPDETIADLEAATGPDRSSLLSPFTDGALEEIHDRAEGVPGVIMAACAELVGLAAWRYREEGEILVTPELAAEGHEYADPRADA